ncbi:Uncharacterised protein [uncultured archaeon]|nr:Uncharacterised protein [uncultured archaeon]
MKSFAGFGIKQIGILIAAISVALFLILASFSIEIAKAKAAACVHPSGEACPITAHIPVASYVGLILLLSMGGLGLNLAVKSEATEKMRKEIAKKAGETITGLQGDEKKAYEAIVASDGVIFQSELVDKMGYSKVKVGRILDKLEGQDLIERRRRGLTNMVLIKYR